MKIPAKNIDEYLALQPEKHRAALERLRKTILSVTPEATEGISYGMPALRLHGKILLYFAGFKNHCSLFPGSKSVILKFKKELKAYKTSAGTISFTAENPLPAALVKKIVRTRVKVHANKIKMKTTAKK